MQQPAWMQDGTGWYGTELWGDTVNVANRLLGAAAPGTIKVSGLVQLEFAEPSDILELFELQPCGHRYLQRKC